MFNGLAFLQLFIVTYLQFRMFVVTLQPLLNSMFMQKTNIIADGHVIEVRYQGTTGDFFSLTDIAKYRTIEFHWTLGAASQPSVQMPRIRGN